MCLHWNSCLIHPKRSIWPGPNAPRLSGRVLHMLNISHWGAGVPPHAFVLWLFSSCVKAPRTKAYLWRAEYTRWALSQQLDPSGSHTSEAVLLSLLAYDLTGKLAGGPANSSNFTWLLTHLSHLHIKPSRHWSWCCGTLELTLEWTDSSNRRKWYRTKQGWQPSSRLWLRVCVWKHINVAPLTTPGLSAFSI